MSKINRKYGWRPDVPDHRDLKYSPVQLFAELPKKVDLRPHCPPVYNQLDLGSCTGQSISGMYHYNEIKQNKKKIFEPSKLFIYYNERTIEGTVKEDAGAQIRTGIKTLVKYGVCSEKTWPYIVKKFARKPTVRAFKTALAGRISQYSRVRQNLDSLKTCLANGLPFVFGFSVYSSFESDDVDRTGVVPMPNEREELLGGHAVMGCGYDDDMQCFIVRNSWGDDWGIKGYFYLPYDFITNLDLADDFWTIEFVP